jgi:hypothetical protein
MQDFEFPDKVVLVLGNEGLGIPTDIIDVNYLFFNKYYNFILFISSTILTY